MKTTTLSTIYLDNQAISLMGDPFPPVAKILAAGGRAQAGVRVERIQSALALRGTPVRLEDIIDRTAEPTKAIYLTCRPDGPETAPAATGHYIAWPVLGANPPEMRGPLPQRNDPPRPQRGSGPGGKAPAGRDR